MVLGFSVAATIAKPDGSFLVLYWRGEVYAGFDFVFISCL
jgi:hypothetical protein